jgi:hypothetical protein
VPANKNSLLQSWSRLLGSSLLLACFVCHLRAQPDPAGAVRDAVRSLAVEIAAQKAIKAPLRLEWLNSSSLSESESRALEEGFLAQLASVRGLLGSEPSLAALRVHLADTPSQLVLSAQFPSSSGTEVRLIRVSRESILGRPSLAKFPEARRQLLKTQREPVLDAMEWRDPASGEKLLLVLTRKALTVYQEGEVLTLRTSAELPGPSLISRDPRGSIRAGTAGANSLSVHLPGEVCSATMPEAIGMSCSPTGRSGARGDAAAADQPVPMNLPCDGHRWTLATDGGDRTTPDRLLLSGEQPGSTGVPLFEFAGPVISLAGDAATAVIVTFNLSSGEYEVYRITFACPD